MALTPASKTLRDRIVNLLRTPGNTSSLNFRVNGKQYRPQGYHAVGEAILKGRIKLFTDTDPNFKGSNVFTYNDQQNRLYLSTGFTGTRDEMDATFIHEATHAVEDGAKWKMTLLDTEVAGYVAQFLYLRNRNAVPKTNNKTPTGQLFAEADKAAEAVMCSINGSFPEAGLRDVITKHPEYSGKLKTKINNNGY